MKRVGLAAAVLAASLAVGVASARAAGTFTVAPATVTAGADVTLSFCGFATGEGGYYTVGGPSVSGTRFWGPATAGSCLTYVESTAGWAPGKYKFIAYVTNSKGHESKVGSAVVTVNAP
jgi:hypothetical protein